jgi:hypothetical protein
VDDVAIVESPHACKLYVEFIDFKY